MEKVNLAVMAYPSAPDEVYQNGKNLIAKHVNDDLFTFSNSKPDALLILTGGSESQAIAYLREKKSTVIIGIKVNNSFAAAAEIKAYCNQQGINAVLLNSPIEELNPIIKLIHTYKNAIYKIKTYKIGLVGEVSDWLIASKVEGNLLKEKLGIAFEKIFWDHYPEYFYFGENEAFNQHFKKDENPDLMDSSKVYNQLKSIITERGLDAFSVECFPMVRKHGVSSCLALSYFNDQGIPAGCEGDLTSLAGMVIGKELTGQIPWMANLVAIEENTVVFAHCTIATCMVNKYKLTTHFESDSGHALQGNFKGKKVTVFRFNRELNQLFIASGEVKGIPSLAKACRTQLAVVLPEKDIHLLQENPLGNHHLVLEGNHTGIMEFFCKMKNIQLIND